MFYSVAMKQENATEQENKQQTQKAFEKKRDAMFKEFLRIHFCQSCIDQFAASKCDSIVSI